ncbi:ABC transporter substrate-binding protein [Paractinoplanes rishiriensis]|uniref:Sugar ABC transporter substrate-binding protein n=1 Tax=Paractinoplanes rishiriensis TaxID=1050105 RepID=A0A919K4W4_9ACTN|nr:extracellular solute-binding protein [Actinoplanes rishiriensis]GIE99362.1 sugar ABC transporter substrate-binding protein [Actinoplanes rishiriensis]
MRRLPVVVSVLTLALGLAACGGDDDKGSGGTAAAPTNCTNKIVNANAKKVLVWAWYPNMAKVVDNFNNTHTDIQVCWTNAGQGQPQYAKFQTAISAKKGAPDVVMLETDQLVGFEIQDALVDLAPFGANDVKKNFAEGSWKDVTQGDAVYAIPIDGGPMAMIYRTDVFEKYGITTPPKTWAEYAEAAAKVKAAGGPVFGDFASNVPAVTTALMQQKGAQPFQYVLSDKQNITVKLDDQATKDVLNYWADLSKKGLVGKEDQFTTDYVSGMVGGKYATYISAAWAPGYLTGAGVGAGDSKGKFAVAPLPQWDVNNPVSVNWGGSTFAVTSQSADKAAAAKVAMELYADPASLEDGWKTQTIFPLNQGVLTSDEFLNAKVDFFSGQTANKDIYAPAAKAYKGAVYSPFTVYYYAQLQEQIVKLNAGETTGDQAATDLHNKIVEYAKTQGFTVK